MKQIERYNDDLQTITTAFSGLQAGLWTAVPGIIERFDDKAITCSVQPSVKAMVTDSSGTVSSVPLPLLLDCPVQFPAGGGCTLTFPVTQGDECLVVFASRCIDGWWQSGGVQDQAELRMHDLSDGFVLLGFRSQPRVIDGISLAAVQLRSDDGQAFVEINPTSHAITLSTSGTLDASADGDTTVTTPLLTLNGNLRVNGTIDASADITAGLISLQQHKTSGVTAGNATSGVPVP
jgi:hypothetical protein